MQHELITKSTAIILASTTAEPAAEISQNEVKYIRINISNSLPKDITKAQLLRSRGLNHATRLSVLRRSLFVTLLFEGPAWSHP
ncbi:hypothetical protein IFT59_21785 [Rhizobium sp. CFBP 8752]|uniref:hypothetical protein n=1 Tax=Rhizobium sp. CFBP 8752 TaxID=2775301 RepID=UPI00177B0A18|nr:hypothetical protein [Rhizobium sp. CFBP 8752]MBD8665879.1 hypothetical protein [Rhizobium sp. CFBP 8752]